YSADGRVKPDVSALGEATATIFEDGYLGFSNGTSLASPIIAGLTACLWQALPHKTTYGIMALIRESAHLFHNPNPELGYGIPNFAWASSGQTTYTPNNIRYTNPVSSILKIENQDLNIKSIQFFDMQGKLICVSENKDESVLTVNVSNWNNGVYIGKAILKDGSQMAMKIIKY
ncbi:S8 family peptidase, partial [Bacteroidales bacterium OttesenSCG-928-E04]|nr:S8 family peptidase [Bacteroidales bacterium OttesenSCG-928-E04]